jgi:translation initiation factor RLI1
MPRPGQVLGLVGTNGIGKSTALKVLAGKLKPNLGRFDVSVYAGLQGRAGLAGRLGV